MKRFVSLLALVLSTSALAAPVDDMTIDGTGRITILAGYRWTPNWYFNGKVAEAGLTVERPSPGGAQGAASFGYGFTDWAELDVDVYGGWETFTLSSYAPFSSITYGALIGPRITKMNFPFPGLVPHLALLIGPTLSTVTSSNHTGAESSQLGYSVTAGLTWKFAERFGLTLDVRYLLARVFVDGISGINVGGLWFSLGVTLYLPTAPKHDLAVPGF